jgi:uncharacterized protein YcfJ
MWGKRVTAVVVVGFCSAGSAFAGGGQRGHSDYVYARVVDVDPIVRYVTVERPREECWDEIVREPVRPYGVAGPTIAGGIVGAAVGRQFGSGSGRDAMTLLGAVVGSAVANQRAVRNHGYATREVAVQRCEVVSERFSEERVDGYRVTYLYQGRRYHMVTDTPPGDRILVAVDVRPVGYGVRHAAWRGGPWRDDE